MAIYVAVALISYLLGSVPFGYLLVRIFRGADIRQTGSGNIGATNVARTGAKGLALATLLLDAGKGLLAVFAAHLIYGAAGGADPRTQYVLMSLAAVFAISGHVFPVWLKFRGGKGVAASVGAYLLIAPIALLLSAAVFLALALTFRFISLASIIAITLFPVFVHVLYPQHPEVLPFIVAAAAVIVVRHRGNIRRLLAGTEPRFGASPR